MPEIFHKLLIQKPPDEVYKTITTQDGLASWWTRDCIAIPEEGSVAEFYFDNRSDSVKMKIKKLEENTTVFWTCIGGHDEWLGTTVSFNLTPHSKGTMLSFSHNEWQSIDGIFPNCNFDWARFLISLKKYCEIGVGEPHTA